MEWISVEDRLPTGNAFYQVYIETDESNFIHGLWWNGKHWCFDNDMCNGEPLFTASWYVSVTHWMLLPDPPKPENSI